MKYVDLNVQYGDPQLGYINYGYDDWISNVQNGDIIEITGSHSYNSDVIILATDVTIRLLGITTYNNRNNEPATIEVVGGTLQLSGCSLTGLKLYGDYINVKNVSDCYLEYYYSCVIENDDNVCKYSTFVAQGDSGILTIYNKGLEYCTLYNKLSILNDTPNSDGYYKHIKTNLLIDNLFAYPNKLENVEDIETVDLILPSSTAAKELFNLGVLDDTYFQSWSRSRNFYIDLNKAESEAATSIGTQLNPFTYLTMAEIVFLNYFISNDNYYLKGNKTSNFYNYEYSSGNIKECFLWIFNFSDIILNFYAWLDNTDTNPVIVSDVSDSFLILSTLSNNVTLNFKDFIIQFKNFGCKSINEGGVTGYYNITYKNCMLISNDIVENDSTTIATNTNYYGCLIDTENYSTTTNSTIAIYDSVINIINPVSFGIFVKFICDNNITTISNFSSYISDCLDLSEYVDPILDLNLIQIKYSDGNDISFYENRNNLNYLNYNVPIGGATEQFRNLNNYNNGLFNTNRITYGSYVFGNLINVGHIGSFNFGNNSNNIIVFAPAILKISSNLNVFMSNAITFKPAVLRFTSNLNVVTQEYFNFDFSAVPRLGTSPLKVKFQAYNYKPLAQFENDWQPEIFNWYLDYANNPTVYVSTTEDSLEYTYTGYENEEFDVRLCIQYKK